MLLHDRVANEDLEDIVRGTVYPLWDAGLKVGYAVRDRHEALGAVDDLDSATATLDLRAVAGDVALAQFVRTEVIRRLRRRPHRFLAALRLADRARRRKAGDAAEVLEPDLKSGAGGLRDIQSLRWAAAALVGTAGLDPLVPAGYLGAPDRPRLSRAENELLSARVALHLVADRTETLRLDLQDPVAERMGIADIDEHELAPHVLRIPREQNIDVPDLHARLLAGLAASGAVLDRGSAVRLRERAERGEVAWRWTDAARDRIVQVLWRGSVASPALAELDEVGVWVAVLPEWAPLRGRPQRNPYHLYALDRHAWHAAAQLGELVRREHWAAETLGDVDDREGLMLGTLLHDVGKAFGEPHSETGVPVAEAIARRMGARPATIDLVGRLVVCTFSCPTPPENAMSPTRRSRTRSLRRSATDPPSHVCTCWSSPTAGRRGRPRGPSGRRRWSPAWSRRSEPCSSRPIRTRSATAPSSPHA